MKRKPLYKRVFRVVRDIVTLRKLRKAILAYTRDLPLIKETLKDKNCAIAMITIPWNSDLYQRPQHLSCQFAKKGIPVFYSNSSKKIAAKIQENIYLIAPDSLPYLPSSLAQKIYFIVTSTLPLRIETAMKMKEKGCKIIYEYIDDFDEKILRDNKIQVDLFNNLEKIDPFLITTSAKRLYEQMVERFGEEKVLFCPNGVDLDNFKDIHKHPIPSEMQPIKEKGKPIVGYYGAMAPWLDWELINTMHEKCPEYEFVYIGMDYQRALNNLHPKENVHFLGPKKYTELPAYAKHFDCCIIPFIEGDIAKSTSPLKLYEFMAMQKPVVCTKDLQECYGYEGVLISENHEKFMKNIKEAIELGKNKQCQDKLFKQACSHTWEKSFEKLITKVTEK